MIEIYTKNWCPYCHSAKAFLDRKMLAYTEYDVTDDRMMASEMRLRSGGHTVPQVFIAGRAVGGHDDLLQLEQRGELDALLQVTAATGFA